MTTEKSLSLRRFAFSGTVSLLLLAGSLPFASVEAIPTANAAALGEPIAYEKATDQEAYRVGMKLLDKGAVEEGLFWLHRARMMGNQTATAYLENLLHDSKFTHDHPKLTAKYQREAEGKPIPMQPMAKQSKAAEQATQKPSFSDPTAGLTEEAPFFAEPKENFWSEDDYKADQPLPVKMDLDPIEPDSEEAPLDKGAPLPNGEVPGMPMPQEGQPSGHPMPMQGGQPMPMQGGQPMPMQGGQPMPMQGGQPMPMQGGQPMPMQGGQPMPMQGGQPMGTAPQSAPLDANAPLPLAMGPEQLQQFSNGQSAPAPARARAPHGHMTPNYGAQPMPSQGVQPMPSQGVQPMPMKGGQPMPMQGVQPTPSQGAQPMPSQGVQPMPSQGVQPAPLNEGTNLASAPYGANNVGDVPTEANPFADDGDAPLFDATPTSPTPGKSFASNGAQQPAPINGSNPTLTTEETLGTPFGRDAQGDNVRYIKGRDGRDGRDGLDGKDGKDGKNGKDGLNNDDDPAFDNDKDRTWEPKKDRATNHHTVSYEPSFDWVKWLLIVLGVAILMGLLAWLLRRLFFTPPAAVPNTTNVNVGFSPTMGPSVNPYKDTQIGLQGRTALRAMPDAPPSRNTKKDTVVDNPF